MEETKQYRCAAYCRVSTDGQQNSIESQVAYFTDIMDNTPEIINCGCYVDFGVSGKSTKGRKAM